LPISQGIIRDNLSTAAGIGDHIGALEWGDHLTGHADGVLESAGANELAGPPTGPRWKIMDNLSTAADIGSFIGALEWDDNMPSDSTLERAAAGPGPLTLPTNPVICHRIDDGVLEAAALADHGATQVRCTQVQVNCVSDGALEAAGMTANLNPPPTHILVGLRCQ
jgi:hypothetical protein